MNCWEVLRDLPKFAATAHVFVTVSSSEESAEATDSEKCKADAPKVSRAIFARTGVRRKAKEDAPVQTTRAKKFKRAEEAVRLQKQHVQELNKRNKIILFMNRPEVLTRRWLVIIFCCVSHRCCRC